MPTRTVSDTEFFELSKTVQVLKKNAPFCNKKADFRHFKHRLLGFPTISARILRFLLNCQLTNQLPRLLSLGQTFVSMNLPIFEEKILCFFNALNQIFSGFSGKCFCFLINSLFEYASSMFEKVVFFMYIPKFLKFLLKKWRSKVQPISSFFENMPISSIFNHIFCKNALNTKAKGVVELFWRTTKVLFLVFCEFWETYVFLLPSKSTLRLRNLLYKERLGKFLEIRQILEVLVQIGYFGAFKSS